MQILLGYRLALIVFLFKCAPNIADQSLQVSRVCEKGQNSPTKNKVHFGHNLAKISYMRVNVNVVHTDALEARL